MSDFVRVDLLDLYLYDEKEKLGDGTLVGAIATLTNLLSSVPIERHGSVQFEIEHEGGYYDSSGSATIKAWYERPKTAEEFEAERLEAERHRAGMARQQEMRERAALAALKAKYGE